MNRFPNILLIQGIGRNVGKTLSACKIIKYLSQSVAPVAVKISPHFHELNLKKIFFKSDGCVIAEEDTISQKDSSRMLQAGAKKVLYILGEYYLIER